MRASVSQLLYSSDSWELQFKLRLWMRRRRCPLMLVYSKAHWEMEFKRTFSQKETA